MATPEGRTKDGFETLFGTDHVAHFPIPAVQTDVAEVQLAGISVPRRLRLGDDASHGSRTI